MTSSTPAPITRSTSRGRAVSLLAWWALAGALVGALVGASPVHARGGAAPATRTAWATAVRDAVARVDGFAAAPAATVTEALVTAEALGTACAVTEVACIVRVGALATTELAVGGRVEAASAGVTLTLDVVDVSRARALRRVVFTAAAGPTAADARLLAVRLLAPERERGFVAVRAPSGSVVSVDGAVVGTIPLAAPVALLPGRHTVIVDHIEYDAFEQTIDVAMGETAFVAVDHGAASRSPASTVATAGAADAATTAAPRGLRVRLYRLTIDPTFPRSTEHRFAKHLRSTLSRVDGVVVVGDTGGAAAGEAGDDEGDDAAGERRVATLAGDHSAFVDADGSSLGADVNLLVHVVRLGSVVIVDASSLRSHTGRGRNFKATLDAGDLDAALRRVTPALLRSLLRDEPIGPIVDDERVDGLPAWALWSTVAAGGASAVAGGTAGALWLGARRLDPALGVVCVAALATSAALAVAAGLEAPYVR